MRTFRRTRPSRLALVAALVVGTATLVTPGTAAAAVCYPAALIAIPGTWESKDNVKPDDDLGLLGVITKALKKGGANVRTYTVAYPAEVGGIAGIGTGQDVPYAGSKGKGIANAEAAAAEILGGCPGTKLYISGFSQGADAAGDLLASIAAGTSSIKASDVGGGFLLADPKRNPTSSTPEGDVPGAKVRVKGSEQFLGPNVPGWGILGTPRSFGSLAERVFSYCNPKDMICATPTRFGNVSQIISGLAQNGDLDAKGNKVVKMIDQIGYDDLVKTFDRNNPASYMDIFNKAMSTGVPQNLMSTFLADPSGAFNQLGVNPGQLAELAGRGNKHDTDAYAKYVIDRPSGTTVTQWIVNYLSSAY